MGIIKYNTKGLTEKQWQDLRRTLVVMGKVGGSDAGTLLGLNEYTSPVILYYKALDIYPDKFKENELTFHGKHLEKYVADMWQYFDGTEDGLLKNFANSNKLKRYIKPNAIFENSKYPFLFANLDGVINLHPVYGKKKGVLEVKTISGYASDRYVGEIPPSYLAQLQHYMIVTGYKYGEIVYLRDGRKLGVQTFEAHRGIQDNILTVSERHYLRVREALKELDNNRFAPEEEKLAIAAQFEPEADGSSSYLDYLNERHKSKPNPNAIQGTAEHLKWAEQYIRYRDFEKEVVKRKQQYMNKIKAEMDVRSANEMILGEGKNVRWNKQFIVNI